MMKLPDNITPPYVRPEVEVRLDANESPFNSACNRYADADALQRLKTTWGQHEHIPAACSYFCNGTEEATDLIMRVYALPNRDSVVAAVPTRSLYKRRALINRLEYREAPLRNTDYELQAEAVLDAVSETTQLIFLCSPNSPTGNLLDAAEIEKLLDLFDGMVVVDEAYIDFAPQASVLGLLNKYKNLIVLRSFSHGWSMAGVHVATVVAHPEVINEMVRVGFSHPLSAVQIAALTHIVEHRLDVDKWVRQITDERRKVQMALSNLPECQRIYHSDANFLLVRFADNDSVYDYLLQCGIAVYKAAGCLRITIGLPNENSALLGALRKRQCSDRL